MSVVNAACSLRRRAVCRYTNIAAIKVVIKGNKKVDMTATPGLLNGAREENTERMIAIAPPAPAIAAISEARITSFSRILDTLGSDNQEKSAPRIPQHFKQLLSASFKYRFVFFSGFPFLH